MTYQERREELKQLLIKAEKSAIRRALTSDYIRGADALRLNIIFENGTDTEENFDQLLAMTTRDYPRPTENALLCAVLANRLRHWMDGNTEEGMGQDQPGMQRHLSLAESGRIVYPKSAAKLQETDTQFDPERISHYYVTDLQNLSSRIKAPLELAKGPRSLGRYLSAMPYLASLIGEIQAGRDLKVKIVQGAGIAKAYASAKLGSCMYNSREYAGAKYIGTYGENDHVALLVIEKAGTVQARALIWAAIDINGEKAVVLDRMYPGDGIGGMAEMLRETAKLLGMTHEYNRNHPPKVITRYNFARGMPYLDTFASILGREGQSMYLATGALSNPSLQTPDGREHLMAELKDHFVQLPGGQLEGTLASNMLKPISEKLELSIQDFKQKLNALQASQEDKPAEKPKTNPTLPIKKQQQATI